MEKQKILVVEDEADVRELLCYNLRANGFEVETCGDGRLAMDKIEEWKPNLVLLDLMLPGLDGFSVCRKLKNESQTSGIRVIMLTARGDEADIVTGLELGADDYITKPFSPKVLIARINAVLRRPGRTSGTGEKDSGLLKVHEIEIDTRKYQVSVSGKPCKLTSTEFRLLCFLAARPGWVFTRYQIVDAVHGADYPVTDRSVDVQVVGLRKKLGEAGKYIETVRGVGYRFIE
ncbi:response regulator [Sedimentisphaera salicampi]|uniref:Phosphate regulon transcriptional regulatory protein PhoB n=1 Tax=Sedimentisphaera salicampi TaxID=1941349 RepID=A0A1W6LLL3_9BACT|nr:response regulator [Sedimentisphaera salicampi]ARN56646.1 Phosphate regulon transcriptional regulatory protein PhoB [Sedimentisphaera salicampi]OXU15217.1 Phosphate regulon transcriptional regulatory protein PhoB [Sedimentisphaera salicampi]